MDEALDLFRRAGYVFDTKRKLTGSLTIYRGNLREGPRSGIAWTLSETKARWFALYAPGSRAQRFGLARRDGGAPVPTVWRGVTDAEDVLGYFGTRRESEVAVDPEAVRDVVAVLRPRGRP